MATELADLIERIAAKHSLLNVSLSYQADPVTPEYSWDCSAQWESDGVGTHAGRGVIAAHGADLVAAILNCSSAVAIAQDGKWPVRSAPALQVAA